MLFRWLALLATLLGGGLTPLPRSAMAMQAVRNGDQIILSGPVAAGDTDMIRAALAGAPQVTTVILRNSFGGDAPTGYRVGELFRSLGLGTAVSGYCISSCSRMFLGGVVRAFTDDYPAAKTKIGFHGHYDRNGRLAAESVKQLGLKDWIMRFTDGKADAKLVERWINIPVARGGAYFFPPQVSAREGASAFFCDGAPIADIFQCEPIQASALGMGVVTTNTIVVSNDQQELRQAQPPPPPSGFAALDDLGRVPLLDEHGRAEYLRFLQSAAPRAFAIAPDGQHWAWNGGEGDAIARALQRCRTRALGQTCQLYAVNDQVVWRAQ